MSLVGGEDTVHGSQVYFEIIYEASYLPFQKDGKNYFS
jgi:hypothetical protein